MEQFDVIIVGGGPAGLNAAVVLGRCQRKVLVFDTGRQRNQRSKGIHNFLTRDNILPTSFLQVARREIRKYGVRFINREITRAVQTKKNSFKVEDKKGHVWYSKKLLIATGVRDLLPDIEGFDEFYCKGVFHCPYCDGWEVRDKNIGIYSRNKNGTELALSLKTWSKHVTLFTDGKRITNISAIKILTKNDIPVVTHRLKKLQGQNGILKKIIFANDESIPCDAIFFQTGFASQCGLLNKMGCFTTSKGIVVTNKLQQTNINGLYVAGDVSKDVQFVVVAAAEGAKAGVAINKDLQRDEWGNF